MLPKDFVDQLGGVLGVGILQVKDLHVGYVGDLGVELFDDASHDIEDSLRAGDHHGVGAAVRGGGDLHQGVPFGPLLARSTAERAAEHHGTRVAPPTRPGTGRRG